MNTCPYLTYNLTVLYYELVDIGNSGCHFTEKMTHLQTIYSRSPFRAVPTVVISAQPGGCIASRLRTESAGMVGMAGACYALTLLATEHYRASNTVPLRF